MRPSENEHRAGVTRARSRVALAIAASVAAALVVVVVVISVAGRSTAAVPPVELISLPPPLRPTTPPSSAPGSTLPATVQVRNTRASISADGDVVAYSQTPADQSYFVRQFNRGAIRVRSTGQTTPLPLVAGIDDEQYLATVSDDGCTVAYATRKIGNEPAMVVWNRCDGSAPSLIDNFGALAASGVPWRSSVDVIRDIDVSSHGRYIVVEVDTSGRDTTVQSGLVWIDRNDLTAPKIYEGASAASVGDETKTPLVAVVSPDTCNGCYAEVRLWNPLTNDEVEVERVDSTQPQPARPGGSAPSMSPDGRFVAYVLAVSVPAGSDYRSSQIFVRDMNSTASTAIALVTMDSDGTPSTSSSSNPSISDDGSSVAFSTGASTFSPITPGIQPLAACFGSNVFVATSITGFYTTAFFDPANVDSGGALVNPGCALNDEPALSANGRSVAWSSTLDVQLTGTATDASVDVYAGNRESSLTVSSAEFGSLVIGQTATQTVAVTNTGLSSVLPATIGANGSEFAVTGGTCAVGVLLPPRQSCTVSLTFTPSESGDRIAGVTVAESGYGALSQSGGLHGVGTAPPTVATLPPTAPPTPPPTTPPTTAPRITAPPVTIAKVQALEITPNPGTFASTVIGLSSAAVDFSVSSSGTAVVPVTSVTIGGVALTDYVVTADTCTGASLKPTATCTVSVIFKPIAGGQRPATLTIASAQTSATADLSATGAFQPTIRLAPNVTPVGRVTIAIGAGFAPSVVVQLQWSTGAKTFNATTDASGAFSLQIPIGPDEETGPRTLTALEQPGVFPSVSTPALIMDGTMQPSGGINPAFGTMTALVVRG